MKKRTSIVLRILLALLFFIIAVAVKIYLGQLFADFSRILSAAVQAVAFGICFWMWWVANHKIKKIGERK